LETEKMLSLLQNPVEIYRVQLFWELPALQGHGIANQFLLISSWIILERFSDVIKQFPNKFTLYFH
jgi:hypothetical protein